MKKILSPEASRVLHGLKMELDPSEWLQAELLKTGTLERQTVNLYGRILHPGDTYVDVGAHVGFHTLVARHFIGAQGKVLAIEPQPYNCEKIMTNWQLNGFDNLVLFVAAAGAADKSIALRQQKRTDKARLSLALDPVNDTPLEFRVPMVRLDTVIRNQNCGAIRLMKIDVEGYEAEVLAGGGRHLDGVQNLIVEYLDGPGRSGRQSSDLMALLIDGGYELRTVEGKPWKPGEILPECNIWASRKQD